ncbi:Integrator complex subunit 6-like [Mortierella hygrophila]|uniref:Integrator complex subunit 6-like n=1 Tax=Mortierella hygrophila TaxID=979708 RepID=A0A9P6JY84_9FUNG|nr:Integrator complex subunit 6-like [Mortierella hygrophila]
MIIVFLVDTSASMNQKFSNGMSALECTKSGIEHLVKHLPQVKPAERHNDKYMLVTYEEGTGCVKSSLKEPLPNLIKELKVLKAQDMSNPGSSLSTIFDILSAYRVHHNIDTPANGRFPGTIEPSIIMWFTDGGRQSSPAGILDRLNIPGVTSAGVDYYHEPFRWDQRLYTIFLEPNAEMVDPQLSILSTVMGGTSYRVRTLRHMLQAMDCMLGISKIPPTQYSPQAVLHIYGVVVNFEDLIVDLRRPNTANHHQLVYVNPNWLNPQTRHSGFFPIPEPYWPEENAQRLPTRNAQPTLHYHTKEEKAVDIPDGFPYDKYVYIKNSYKTEGYGFPFGFLKANTTKNAVTLTVVAYNYPALFTLIVNLGTNRNPSTEWRRDFAEYLSHTPSYYYNVRMKVYGPATGSFIPLRNALKRIGLYNIMPAEQGTLGLAIQNVLSINKLKARVDLDRLQAIDSSAPAEVAVSKKRTHCANAFDVPRSELISVLGDLKLAFFKELQLTSTTSLSLTPSNVSIFGGIRSTGAKADLLMDSDDFHTLPIADMGIYQDRMQKIQRENLRDPFRDEESVKSLQKTMFGNPYKQDKKVSIDEENEASAADDSMSSTNSSGGSSWSSILGGRKRKPRRRSVSPSPFPLEKIPSLAHGARSVSGKVQVVSLGASAGVSSIPTLRIVVQESFGKILSTEEEPDVLSRRPGMHDGEDEAEDDEDFRRAMFNSDEMEMDGEDEAARLRADTPMPGGIGLDDDDESMEDMQRAQDLIPPPLAVVDLDDIERRKAELPFLQNDDSADMKTNKYMKHQQGIEHDLEHFNGLTKPVFPSLVYDPTALMELQSIPSTIPERSDPGASYPPNGISTDAKSSGRDGDTEYRVTGESPLDYRNAIIKELKMEPRSYNETMVMEMVWKVEGSDWTRDQKQMTVAHCLTVARGFRRHPIVLALEVHHRATVPSGTTLVILVDRRTLEEAGAEARVPTEELRAIHVRPNLDLLESDLHHESYRREDKGRYEGNDRGRRGDNFREYDQRGGARGDPDTRRDMRAGIKFSIWAPSPSAEELRNRSPSPDREVKKKSEKSKKHDSGSESDRSDEDRKRRRKSSKRRKDKRSSSRHRNSRHKSTKRPSKRTQRSPTTFSASEDESRDGAKSYHDEKVALDDSLAITPRGASSVVQNQPDQDDGDMEFPDDMWVEKKVEMPEDDQDVGPTPLHLTDHRLNERSYGGALLAGEGSAMAAYVQDGKRIPRRGEIGLESDQIERYEHSGYVMSGSRHQRMNAVRVRKENQVISAEEKRALLIFNQEEKIKKDNKIINEMREMVASKLRSTGHSV